MAPDTTIDADSRRPWSPTEVEAIVDDYRHMLIQELSGQAYSKAAHRRALSARLDHRSDGSIEFKHQNISAILIAANCPYISGYKRRDNVQALLQEVVEARIIRDELFDRSALLAAEQPALAPVDPDFSAVLTAAPVVQRIADAQAPAYLPRSRGIVRDYLDREARNRSLGLAGECFVLAYERDRLLRADRPQLSERVEHIARTRGDGLGYDILSFDEHGRDRYIEVKTTAFGMQTPFYVSRNEKDFADAMAPQFQLYRLFDFRRQPRLFTLAGPITDHCLLDTASYLARFA